MKIVVSIVLWSAALLLAVWVLYRLVRRKPMLLHGRVARRAIRVAAVVMVALGANRLPAQPADTGRAHDQPQATDELAPEVLLEVARDVRELLFQEDPANWYRAWLSEDRSRVPDAEAAPHLRRVLDHAAARAQGDPPDDPLSAQTIARALDEMRRDAKLLNEPLNLLLWHELSALPAPEDADEAAMLAAAMGRVRDNARMLNTLTRAAAQTGVSLRNTNPQGWRSKAGPRPRDYDVAAEDVEAFVEAVQSLYATSDTGLWEREGVVQLTPVDAGGDVALIRQRQSLAMEAGETYRVGRLDLLQTGETGGRLHSTWLGDIELPTNATLRLSDLPALLDDAARERIDEAIAQAARGDEDALLLIERHMPLCVEQVVDAILQLDAADASGLNLLVYLYDPMLNQQPSHWRYFEHAVNFRHDGAGWMDGPAVPVERGEGPGGGLGGPGGLLSPGLGGR